MKKTSHYISISYEYQNSHEMQEHLRKMEELKEEGWKCTSFSFMNLKARFRKEVSE
jgi:hypothetical protein